MWKVGLSLTNLYWTWLESTTILTTYAARVGTTMRNTPIFSTPCGSLPLPSLALAMVTSYPTRTVAEASPSSRESWSVFLTTTIVTNTVTMPYSGYLYPTTVSSTAATAYQFTTGPFPFLGNARVLPVLISFSGSWVYCTAGSRRFQKTGVNESGEARAQLYDGYSAY